MKVIETNHDGQIIHKSLGAMAQSIITELAGENVLRDYFDNEEDFLVFSNNFDNQSEAEQIRLLECLSEDVKFTIVK